MHKPSPANRRDSKRVPYRFLCNQSCDYLVSFSWTKEEGRTSRLCYIAVDVLATQCLTQLLAQGSGEGGKSDVAGKASEQACVALRQIEFSWSASKTHRFQNLLS